MINNVYIKVGGGIMVLGVVALLTEKWGVSNNTSGDCSSVVGGIRNTSLGLTSFVGGVLVIL